MNTDSTNNRESAYISVEELYQAQQEAKEQARETAPTVIDVRSAEEFAAGHIAGAIHIPADELAQRLDELPRNRPAVPY